MKKAITLLLTAAILTTACITAFAEEITQNSSEPRNGTTSVTMSVDPTYTVTIPESVVLEEQTDGTYAKDAVVTATNIRLNNNKQIKVTLTSDFLLENAQGAADLPYTLTIDSTEIASGDTVATFASNADLTLVQESDTLHFAAGVPEFAGDYSDTVMFNISVADAT